MAEQEWETEEPRCRVAELQGAENVAENAGPVGVDHCRGDVHGRKQDWRPPRSSPGLTEAGVVAQEEQPDEEHAFGPTALVAELLGEYFLTLPPETYLLDDARCGNPVRWRRDALAEAQRELRRAKRARLLRRVITLR